MSDHKNPRRNPKRHCRSIYTTKDKLSRIQDIDNVHKARSKKRKTKTTQPVHVDGWTIESVINMHIWQHVLHQMDNMIDLIKMRLLCSKFKNMIDNKKEGWKYFKNHSFHKYEIKSPLWSYRQTFINHLIKIENDNINLNKPSKLSHLLGTLAFKYLLYKDAIYYFAMYTNHLKKPIKIEDGGPWTMVEDEPSHRTFGHMIVTGAGVLVKKEMRSNMDGVLEEHYVFYHCMWYMHSEICRHIRLMIIPSIKSEPPKIELIREASKFMHIHPMNGDEQINLDELNQDDLYPFNAGCASYRRFYPNEYSISTVYPIDYSYSRGQLRTSLDFPFCEHLSDMRIHNLSELFKA